MLASPQKRKRGRRHVTIPSKPEQIKAVARFLDQEELEGKSLEEIAKAIVEGYHKLLLGKLKSPASPARLGMLFKTPLDGKLRRFVWEGEGRAWVVSETDSYGWLGPLSGPLLEYCEEFRPKRRRDGKMVEPTDDDIAEEWSNPDWQVGDVVSQHQRQYSFEVIATAPRSVLLKGADGRLTVAENGDLSKYYKREIKGLESGW